MGSDQTEVAGAEKCRHFILFSRQVERVKHAQARKAQVGRQRAFGALFEILKLIGVEEKIVDLVLLDQMDPDRVMVDKATVKELKGEPQVFLLPGSLSRDEPNRLVIVVAQFFQRLGQFGTRVGMVFRSGQCARLLAQRRVIEGRQRTGGEGLAELGGAQSQRKKDAQGPRKAATGYTFTIQRQRLG